MKEGKLIEITGEQGTRYLGILRQAKVCDVVDGTHWRLGGGRCRIFQDLIQRINDQPIPLADSGLDIFMWKHGHDDYQTSFSAGKTWEQIRDRREKVDWCSIIWFTQAVPRYSFITWLTIMNRLSTGDRMRNWGVQHECLLCGEKNETRDHLFFACPFSYIVWITVTGRLLGRRVTPDWQDTVTRLRYDRGAKMDKILGRMVFQMTVYHIWRERNARRHEKP